MRPRRRKLRIAYGRISQETHAYSPLPSTLEDFGRMHLLGPRGVAHAANGGQEVPGLLRKAELSGFAGAARKDGEVQAVPLMSAWALPSGPLTEDAYDSLRGRLVQSLRDAGPVDGVYLSLHGAMRARGQMQEAEQGFLEAARDVVGPEVPIAASFDLHGHITEAKLAPTTFVTAYQTNPHRDMVRVGRRTGEMLIRTLRGEVTPVTAWRRLPMVLGGGTTIDLMHPMRAIFRRMRQMERVAGVLYVSLFTCHPWNDAPDLGWSVNVVTNGDQTLADQLADELAALAWSVRDHGPPTLLDPAEAIAQIRNAWFARMTGTVCLVDASDVVGAGSVGESTHLLRAFLDMGAGLRAYIPLRDAQAVAELWRVPRGSEVTITVGGRFAPVTSPATQVHGRLLQRVSNDRVGRAVVLAIGEIRLVLTDRAPYTVKPSFYGDVGLDPWRADVVVVKSFFHFRPYYALVNRKTLGVRTEGLTNFS